MASIQKRGQTYRVRIIRKGYAPLTRTFSRYTEAKKWARNTESRMDSGEIKPISTSTQKTAENTLFKTAAEHYANTLSKLKRNHKSEAGILRILARRWDGLSVALINSQQVAALRDEMLQQGRSGTTVGHYLNAISVTYQMLANEWGLPIKNPTRGIKRPPQNPPRFARLSPDARAALETACSDCSHPLLLPIVKLALETGMRRGEILSLTWADADLENRRIRLERTKNGLSRSIPISDISLSILKSLNPADGVRLFPIGAESMRKQFERAVNRAEKKWPPGLPNPFERLRFHDLRHEALSRLSDKGLNVIELSQFSGHRTLRMLARYTHPDDRAILEKINRI